MTILAIDPGPTESAFVAYGGGKVLHSAGKLPNELMLLHLERTRGTLVIEQISCMGMSVGAEVFETVFWSGRFAQAFRGEWHRLKRHEVKMHLCGNMRAKDGNIRQALIDKFGPGKEAAIGKKKSPGPLYGLAGDQWQALALAVTWDETKAKENV